MGFVNSNVTPPIAPKTGEINAPKMCIGRPPRQSKKKTSACRPDMSDIWQPNESLLLRWKDPLEPQQQAAEWRGDEGGHAQAGEVANRMEQPSALFSILYVQEVAAYTFYFNVTCKSCCLFNRKIKSIAHQLPFHFEKHGGIAWSKAMTEWETNPPVTFFYVAAGSRNWRKTQVYLKKQKLKKKKKNYTLWYDKTTNCLRAVV